MYQYYFQVLKCQSIFGWNKKWSVCLILAWMKLGYAWPKWSVTSPWVHLIHILHDSKFQTFLSSWWFQPLWKICSSKWESSPNTGENKKSLKPPPRYNPDIYNISINCQVFVKDCQSSFFLTARFPHQLGGWCIQSCMPLIRAASMHWTLPEFLTSS